MSGTGAGVFTDLGFTFTAVDGGKKCTDTKDLEVSIEVLSNEVVATGEEVGYMAYSQAWRIVYHVLLLSNITFFALDGDNFRFSS